MVVGGTHCGGDLHRSADREYMKNTWAEVDKKTER